MSKKNMEDIRKHVLGLLVVAFICLIIINPCGTKTTKKLSVSTKQDSVFRSRIPTDEEIQKEGIEED